MREKHDIRSEPERIKIKGEAEFSCKFCPIANYFESEAKCKKHEETWHKVVMMFCLFSQTFLAQGGLPAARLRLHLRV